jgi:hypothetical protein
VKSLHPAATQKPHPQPRAHSKSRLLLLCTSRSNGYPRRGLGYCRERGSCGEACGAPKGGFNCLEGRERKPRHPLPRGVCPTEGGETRRSVGVSRGQCPMGRADLPTGRPESTRPMQGSTAARRPFAMEEAPTVPPSGEPLPTSTTRTSLFSWVERPHCTFPRGRRPARWAWFTIPVSGRAGSHPGL